MVRALLGAIALWLGVTLAASAAQAGDQVFRYRTADGRQVFVDEWSKIPPEYRTSAVQSASGTSSRIYRYKTTGNRWGYVNDIARIPPARKNTAEAVALSHISLNHDMTPELVRVIDLSHRAAQQSPACEAAKNKADASWPVLLWAERPAVVAIAALAIILLLITPWMSRQLLPGMWTKLLATLMPALLVVGIMVYAAKDMTRVKRQLAGRAAPCRSDVQATQTMQTTQATQTTVIESLSLVEKRMRDLEAMQALIDQHAR